MAYIELNPGRHEGDRLRSPSDVVEVWNDYGSTFAMAYPVADAKPRTDVHGVCARQGDRRAT